MKHLRKFNESDNYNNLTNIINECKDILIEYTIISNILTQIPNLENSQNQNEYVLP